MTVRPTKCAQKTCNRVISSGVINDHKYSFRIAAWGASDFVSAGEAAGFDADEGFDTFLAMDAPPEQVRTNNKIYINDNDISGIE